MSFGQIFLVTASMQQVISWFITSDMTLCDSATEEATCCGTTEVKVFANGSCKWFSEFQMSVSHCPIDITWFPFDDQVCELVYESETHESDELNVSRASPAVELESYTRNGEWALLGKHQQDQVRILRVHGVSYDRNMLIKPSIVHAWPILEYNSVI